MKYKEKDTSSFATQYGYRLGRKSPCRNLLSINKKLCIQKSSSAEILITEKYVNEYYKK